MFSIATLTVAALVAAFLLAAVLGFAKEAFRVGDASLQETGALPDGAASTNSGSIDLGHNATGSFLAKCEFKVDAPALATADLPDTETMTYDVITSDSDDLSTPTVVIDNLITQTGAGGAGAAAAEARFRLPANVQRFVGIRATNSGAGDASDKSMTLSLLV